MRNNREIELKSHIPWISIHSIIILLLFYFFQNYCIRLVFDVAIRRQNFVKIFIQEAIREYKYTKKI